MQTTSLILNIIFTIAFVPSLVLIYVSFFIFDNGTDGIGRWTLYVLFNCVPLSILITQIIAWIAYSNSNYELAIKVSLLPLIVVFLIGLFFLKDYFS
jgi:hypothetical protein